MLEVAMEQMFTEPSILETIASVTLALRQYESAGSSAPPAALEAAEAVPEESTAGAESAAVVLAPPPTREDQEASLPQPAEAAASAATATEADAVVDVVEEAGLHQPVWSPPLPMRFPCRTSPPQPLRSTMLPRVRQEPPPWRSRRPRRTRAQLCRKARQAVKPRPSSSPAPHGPPLLSTATTPRTTRRSRRATPWSAG
jgi:hypothetical protein